MVEAIQTAYGEIELSLSPVTGAELVHGIYRAKTPEVSQRRREYIDELVKLLPLHRITLQTAYLMGSSNAARRRKETHCRSTIR